MASKFVRVIICIFLQIIIGDFCFACDRELYILNNSLFVRETKVIVLRENQKAYYLNIAIYHNIYFWNSFLLYRVNSKSGGWVLFDTTTQKQIFINGWIEDFYIVNDELCAFTGVIYKCLTSEREYNSNAISMRLPSLIRKEIVP